VSCIGSEVIAEEVRRRHAAAYPERPVEKADLDWGGEYQWRRDGEHHQVNPDMIARLQASTRSGSYAAFKEYSRMVDDQSRHRATLRGLFALKPAGPAVPLDEVESVESILTRFATGAMSYGSISQEAHETLAIAMNRIGGRSNTGEGGEDAARYVRDANGDWRRSAVKLVAEVGVGTVAAGVAKAHADVVLISGHDGGTGASPLTSIKHGGVPWELGLAETQQVLVLNKLRDRIVVQTDGQMKSGRDVV